MQTMVGKYKTLLPTYMYMLRCVLYDFSNLIFFITNFLENVVIYDIRQISIVKQQKKGSNEFRKPGADMKFYITGFEHLNVLHLYMYVDIILG